MIQFEDFKKVSLKTGTVISVEEIEKSDKLYKLMVDVGEEHPRQIVAGLRQDISKEEIVNQQIVVVVNLEPKKLMGIESQGMILAARSDEALCLISPKKEIKNGTEIS